MTFLVTGASGHLGSQVVADLRQLGHSVVAMARNRLSGIEADHWLIGDIETFDWHRDTPPIDGIAAIGSSLDLSLGRDAWTSCVGTNVIGLQRLVEFAIARNTSRFVYTSSAGLYLRPPSHLPVNELSQILPLRPYWTSKLLGEQLLQTPEVSNILNPWILRLASPYGPRAQARSVLPIFVQRACSGESLHVKGQGGRSQDFVSIWDASWAHIQCLLSEDRSPGILNIGSGQETTMLELAKTANRVFDNPAKIKFDEPDGSDKDRFVLDVSKLQEFFQYSPMTLEAGLNRWKLEQST